MAAMEEVIVLEKVLEDTQDMPAGISLVSMDGSSEPQSHSLPAPNVILVADVGVASEPVTDVLTNVVAPLDQNNSMGPDHGNTVADQPNPTPSQSNGPALGQQPDNEEEVTDEEYEDEADRNLEDEYPDGRCFEEGEIASEDDLGEDGEVISSLEMYQYKDDEGHGEEEEGQLVESGSIKLKKLSTRKIEHCTKCSRQFVSLLSLESHQKVHSEEGIKFTCRYCRRVFSSEEDYEEHVVTHNNECFFMCGDCGKKFYTADYLTQHARSHEGRYKCHKCPMRFEYNERLRTHLKSHGIYRTGPRRTGGKRAPRDMSIVKEQYRCEFCGKKYLTLGAFKKHKFVEHEEEYTCDTCGKIFTAFTFLRQHIAKDHKTRSYMCQHCGKTFIHRWYFKRHEMTHTGTPALTCRFCNATFAALGNYTRHFRIHTGEKPFVCSFCGRSFAENGTLKRHERTHTGVKPFACKLCDKAFAVSHAMKRHMRTHDIVKGFPCKFCSSAYYTQRSLERHEKQKHSSPDGNAAELLTTGTPVGEVDVHQLEHHGMTEVHMEVPVSVAEQVGLQIHHEDYPIDQQVVIQEAVIHTTEDQQAVGQIMSSNFMDGQMLQQIQLQDGRNVFASVYEQGGPGNWQAQIHGNNNVQQDSDPNQLSDDLIRREFERRFGKQKQSPKKRRKKQKKHPASSSGSSSSSSESEPEQVKVIQDHY